jgi:ubiquitin C-terminal hydrolase
LQHDAQEFLICLLVRLSEEVKSKAEYGSSKVESEENNKEILNKKIVKFFSGKTEAITECVRCSNKNTRIEPFFTYSLSLTELKEMEFHYYFIEIPSKATSTIPMRYGITLDRKVTVEEFL